MKTQNPDPVLEDDYMVNIFKSKKRALRALLLPASPTVDERCKQYMEALPTLSSVAKQEWAADLRDALISCYDINTISLSKLKDALLDALGATSASDLQRCPYCMLDEPSTWDHYLPKTHYPEYSVFCGNLVYVCFRCNHRKGEDFDGNKLLFCHPYFTVHLTSPVLHCNVSVEDDGLNIEYYVAGSAELGPYVEIAMQHMERLKLARRFSSESAAVVSMFIAELRQQFTDGMNAEVLKKILRHRYRAVDMGLGPNAWEARLWHALAACPHFFGYVNTQIASDKHPFRDGFELVAPPPML